MRTGWLPAIGSALCLALCSPAKAALFDHSAYDAVLHHYVDAEGYADYDSIRLNSLTALESYFENLADADLAGWPSAERLAFWINAYNARTLYWIAQKDGMKKVSEDFELFNRPFKIAGRRLSLNDIKHRILRGTVNPDNHLGPIPGVSFKNVDPRIHFALAGGAVSSPPLKNFAYTAENIDDVLQMNAAAFANSSKYMDVSDGRLRLPSLFKWYTRDFESAGGVPAFLNSLIISGQRLDADAVRQLLRTGYAKALFTYDWTLNDQKNKAVDVELHEPPPGEIPPDAFSTSNPRLQ